MIQITTLNAPLADICQREFGKIGWTKPDGYFAACLEQQNRDALVFFAAFDEDHYVGHVKLVWTPDYVHFRQAGIPEINDLNVLPNYRKQGIGTRLIQRCEATAATRSAPASASVLACIRAITPPSDCTRNSATSSMATASTTTASLSKWANPIALMMS